MESPPVTEAPANLRRVPLDELANAEPPTVAYVVDDLLPLALVLLGGHGGAGKSILALIIAAHVAVGVPFCGHAVRQGRVVFVSLEDPAAVVRWRLRKIVDTYGLDPAAVVANLIVLDGSEGNSTLASELADMGQRTILPTATLGELQVAAAGAVLVIVDNASDAFDGNENDRRQVRGFMRMLAKLGREVGAAVLLLAHIDKTAARYGAAGNSYSGSTAWHNSARARWVLTIEDGAVVLGMEKNNLGRLADPLHFRWNDYGVLLPAGAVELVEAEARDPRIAHDNLEVMGCLWRAIARNNVPTAKLGAHNTYAALARSVELPGWAKKDRDRFWHALVRLDRLGWIGREEYRTPSRHTSERWIVNSSAPDEFQSPPNWAGSAQ